MPTIESLYMYPVKSCAGIELRTSEVLGTGLLHDRRWMVIDEDRRYLTQRDLPRMAHVATALDQARLTLSAPGLGSISIGDDPSNTQYEAQIWEAVVRVVDEGDEAATWLSTLLGAPVRLVRMADDVVRPVDPDFALTGDDRVMLVDGFPILVLLKESLDDLNQRMSETLPIVRFRPNIVISGAEAYAEDGWQTLRLPNLELELVKPSSRCVITQTDPETLAIGKEPLRTLAGYRRQGSKVLFGWNAIPRSPGTVAVGDHFEVTAKRPALFA